MNLNEQNPIQRQVILTQNAIFIKEVIEGCTMYLILGWLIDVVTNIKGCVIDVVTDFKCAFLCMMCRLIVIIYCLSLCSIQNIH